jgi:SH3-like domain-containing protein
MKQTVLKFICLVALLGVLPGWVASAQAIEYASVGDVTAILYDSNSTKAKKLFVVSRYTPLEKVVSLSNWIKVRDRHGTMAWIEKRALSDKNYVVVTVPLAAVRQAPEANSPVLFQVSQNVAMESLGINGGGWIKARHQDGSIGYMKSIDVWGAE